MDRVGRVRGTERDVKMWRKETEIKLERADEWEMEGVSEWEREREVNRQSGRGI